MSKMVSFNESHIGAINEGIFTERLNAADITPEVLSSVDAFREDYVASIGKEVLAYAEENSLGNGEGTGCSVSEISLGGNAIANVIFTQGGEFRMEVTHRYNGDLMKEVQSQAETLWQKFNVTE